MERIKIWTAIDRNRNKVVAFELSINSNNNDSIICRRLLNKVRNVDSNTYINSNSNSSSISNNNIENKNNKNNKNKEILIDIIATDGNYSYNKVINTKDIVLIDKDNKDNNNNNNKLIIKKDCNRHIVTKSETCLVEAWNSSLRGRFARFNRRTKSFSRSIKSVYDTVSIWVYRDVYLQNIKRYSIII